MTYLNYVMLAVLLVTQLLGAGREPAARLSQRQGFAPTPRENSLIQLPKRCKQMLPPDGSEPVCCMFGYVIIDGQAVDSARVTVTNPRGTTIEVWTNLEDGSPQPFYGLNLSEAPLNVEPGDQLTVTAQYSGHKHSLVYTAQSGGQQVDIVLPRNYEDDYVFDRRIWKQGGEGEFNNPQDVAIDRVGNIYVNDNDNARIQMFNEDGKFIAALGTLGNKPGQFSDIQGITIDKYGYLYIADAGNYRVQKITNGGKVIAVWGREGQGNGEFETLNDIAVDDSGFIYVSSERRVQKFDSNGKWLLSWDLRDSVTGELYELSSLAVDKEGNVYVGGITNSRDVIGRIMKFDSVGKWITGWNLTDSIYGDGRNWPSGMAVNINGNILITDNWNHLIEEYTKDGYFVSKWGGVGSGNGKFFGPEGIAVDGNGNSFVCDDFHGRVQKFSLNHDWVMNIGKKGSSFGHLYHPQGVVVDDIDSIYVADEGNGRIQKYDAYGNPVSIYGGELSSIGYPVIHPEDVYVRDDRVYASDDDVIHVYDADNGMKTAIISETGDIGGVLRDPDGISIDSLGDIYVTDYADNRIHKFNANGIWKESWVFNSPIGFYRPSGIAIDSNDRVYITDYDTVQKFTRDGEFVVKWGKRGRGNGEFWTLRDISVDNSGNIYTTESINRVQKFTSDGRWVSTWGGEGAGPGEFHSPQGIEVNSKGEVIVADYENNNIQIFRSMTHLNPIATVVTTGPREVTQGQAVRLIGMGGSSDHATTIAGYEWTFDGSATPFAQTAETSFDTTGIPTGVHKIAFRVRDSAGRVSEPQEIDINVLPLNKQFTTIQKICSPMK